MLLFNIIYIMRISNRYPIVGRGFTASIYRFGIALGNSVKKFSVV